jgi:hypothetical protein
LLNQVDKINEIDRFQEIPYDGPFCDFMWADPIFGETGKMKRKTLPNSTRAVSIFYG